MVESLARGLWLVLLEYFENIIGLKPVLESQYGIPAVPEDPRRDPISG
jgi:hypothetical protein